LQPKAVCIGSSCTASATVLQQQPNDDSWRRKTNRNWQEYTKLSVGFGAVILNTLFDAIVNKSIAYM